MHQTSKLILMIGVIVASIQICSFNAVAQSAEKEKAPDLENLTPEQQRQYDSWVKNKSWVDALLAEADPGEEYISTGSCYVFQRAALEEYSRNSWFVLNRKWPSGFVYYSFNPNNMTEFKKEQFRLATTFWEDAAQVGFFELPFGQEGVPNWIEVRDATVNNSIIGMSPFPGAQTLNMFNWEYEYIVAHEIGHALGQWHEHTRADRDTYITVDTDNIVPSINVSNWNIQTGEHLGTAYDFESVMHYAPSSGAVAGTTIIGPQPGFESFFNSGLVGQRTRLSDIDKAGMALRYGALSPCTPPDLNFASGTYNVATLTLTLVLPFDHQNGLSRYFYTLDGSDPTRDSLEFTPNGSVLLSQSATVKVRHIRKFRSPSAVLSRTYTLSQATTPQVATPQILPALTQQTGPFNCTISSSTPGAQIYFTLNGSTPTQGSTLYTAPININQSTTVKARAFKDGHTPSDIATKVYDIAPLQLPPPTIFPNGGSFNGSVIVSLSTTIQGATIRYTTDGSEPTISSTAVDENPLTLTTSATVKAKVFRDGYTPSNTAQAAFTIVGSANTPTITPNGGTFTAPQSVTLATTTVGAEIRYTLNGSEPQAYSPLYSSAINLPLGATTVKAKAFLTNATPSGTASADFTVFSADAAQVNAPTYLPVGRDHMDEVLITLSCNTEGAQIRYTVGDNVQPADPTAASTLYTGPFTLGLTPGAGDFWFVKARAFKGGLTDSIVVGKTYGVYEPLGTIAAPAIDPNGGTFNNAVTVNFTSSTNPVTDPSAIQFFRTINGSEPFVPDPASGGANSFSLSQPANVKVLAFRAFFGDSAITESAPFVFVCADPTFAPEANYHIDEVQFSIATDTTASTRRYTLDGSEPEASPGNGFTYTTPVTLGIGTHIVKAKVFRNNFDPSETITQVYVVEPQPVPPVITDQPTSQTVNQGDNVEFTIAATGVPDPEYQWQYNSISISGETTTTLRLPNVSPDNDGEYRCIVSNKAGATTSSVAILTVIPGITPTPTETPTPTPTMEPMDCYRFEIPIEASQEPVNSDGSGSAVIQVDTITNTLTYYIQYFNLSSPETMAHIHGFAERGAPAGVLYTLPLGSPKSGTINYDEPQEADILAGLTYINIHTENFTGGEIRGQIDGTPGPCLTPTPTPDPTTEPLDGWRISEPEDDNRDRRVSMLPRPEPLPAP